MLNKDRLKHIQTVKDNLKELGIYENKFPHGFKERVKIHLLIRDNIILLNELEQAKEPETKQINLGL
jgi:hypothetical protein